MRYPLKPIRTIADFKHASETYKLLREIPRRTQEQEDYLYVLRLIIENYETPGGKEFLVDYMTRNELNQSQLAIKLKISPTTLSNILAGRRPISAKMRKAMSQSLAVPEKMLL